jgi:tetratricopeptide (TPR) repeat protein
MMRFLAALLLAGTLLRAQDDSAAMKQASDALDHGYFDKAIAAFTTALQQNPKDIAALLGRGNAYAQKADSDKSAADKAIADFTQVIALDPKNEKAWYEMGNTQYEKAFFGSKDDKQKAVDDFTHAIQLNPKDAEAWRMRGMAYGALFERQKEIDDDTSAIQADPKYTAAWGDRGVTYANLHQYDKALADDTKAIALASGDEVAEYYVNRGDAYEESKDYVHAVADFTQATQLQASDSEPYESLAELLATCPDPKVRDGKKAVAIATKAYEISHEQSPQALEALAAAYAETGDFDNAVKWQTKWLATLGVPPAQDSRMKLYLAHKPYRDDGSDSGN